MRLEVAYRNGEDERERVYLLEDAADFELEATCAGDVVLRARSADVVWDS